MEGRRLDPTRNMDDALDRLEKVVERLEEMARARESSEPLPPDLYIVPPAES
jgi:hypothetical protein